MLPLITEDYLDLSVYMHLKWPSYGAAGKKWADAVASFDIADILDYGCGKGTLREVLGKHVKEFDPCIPGKNRAPKPADLVVCTDVLEHVEPHLLDSVLTHLRYLTKQKAFLVIATREADKVLGDGRNAHLIIEPISWWRQRLEQLFTIDHLEEKDDGEFLVVCH